jgi:hypothetical protein
MKRTYFKNLPEVVRQVEHDPLQEQNKGNPLVVGMVDLKLRIKLDMRRISGFSYIQYPASYWI